MVLLSGKQESVRDLIDLALERASQEILAVNADLTLLASESAIQVEVATMTEEQYVLAHCRCFIQKVRRDLLSLLQVFSKYNHASPEQEDQALTQVYEDVRQVYSELTRLSQAVLSVKHGEPPLFEERDLCEAVAYANGEFEMMNEVFEYRNLVHDIGGQLCAIHPAGLPLGDIDDLDSQEDLLRFQTDLIKTLEFFMAIDGSKEVKQCSLDDFLKRFRGLENGYGVKVFFSVPPNLTGKLTQFDEHKLRRMFLNLIINSRNAEASYLKLSISSENGVFCVCCEDDGVGMLEGYDPYQARLCIPGQTNGHGTQVIRQIAEELGLTLVKERTPVGKGAVLKMYQGARVDRKHIRSLPEITVDSIGHSNFDHMYYMLDVYGPELLDNRFFLDRLRFLLTHKDAEQISVACLKRILPHTTGRLRARVSWLIDFSEEEKLPKDFEGLCAFYDEIRHLIPGQDAEKIQRIKVRVDGRKTSFPLYYLIANAPGIYWNSNQPGDLHLHELALDAYNHCLRNNI